MGVVNYADKTVYVILAAAALHRSGKVFTQSPISAFRHSSRFGCLSDCCHRSFVVTWILILIYYIRLTSIYEYRDAETILSYHFGLVSSDGLPSFTCGLRLLYSTFQHIKLRKYAHISTGICCLCIVMRTCKSFEASNQIQSGLISNRRLPSLKHCWHYRTFSHAHARNVL